MTKYLKFFVKLALLVAVSLVAGVGLASADYRSGVAAYERRDYREALDEFVRLGRQGDHRAQYRSGLMYAQGLGVPRDSVTALKWMLCVEQKAESARLRSLAGDWRGRLQRRVPSTSLWQAGEKAHATCGADVPQGYSLTELYQPVRPTLWQRLVFLPGDLTIYALLDVAQSFGLSAVKDACSTCYRGLGDYCVGVICLLWYVLLVKLLLVGVRAMLRALTLAGRDAASDRRGLPSQQLSDR